MLAVFVAYMALVGRHLLPGKRDWSGFTSTACTVEDRVRTLTVASFERTAPDEGCFTFVGDGFLRYMVRNLVGTTLLVARGKMPLGRIPEILESGDRDLAGPTAPAHGLCLEAVRYAEDGSGA